MARFYHPAHELICQTVLAFSNDRAQAYARARLIVRDLVCSGWLEAEMFERAGPPDPPFREQPKILGGTFGIVIGPRGSDALDSCGVEQSGSSSGP